MRGDFGRSGERELAVDTLTPIFLKLDFCDLSLAGGAAPFLLAPCNPAKLFYLKETLVLRGFYKKKVEPRLVACFWNPSRRY